MDIEARLLAAGARVPLLPSISRPPTEGAQAPARSPWLELKMTESWSASSTSSVRRRSISSFTYIHGISWSARESEAGILCRLAQPAPAPRRSRLLGCTHAKFDQGVLGSCCQASRVSAPDLPFLCTVKLQGRAGNCTLPVYRTSANSSGCRYDTMTPCPTPKRARELCWRRCRGRGRKRWSNERYRAVRPFALIAFPRFGRRPEKAEGRFIHDSASLRCGLMCGRILRREPAVTRERFGRILGLPWVDGTAVACS